MGYIKVIFIVQDVFKMIIKGNIIIVMHHFWVSTIEICSIMYLEMNGCK